MPEATIDLINSPYYMWQDRGVAITNLHKDEQGYCLNTKIADQVFDVAQGEDGRWGMFQHRQDRKTEPVLYLSDSDTTPIMNDIVRATLRLSKALDAKRISLLIPSREDSLEKSGYLLLSAGKEELAKWRVMEGLSVLSQASNMEMKHSLPGVREITNENPDHNSIIQIKDPEAVSRIQELLGDKSFGIIPTSEIRALGKANFIDVDLKTLPGQKNLGIFSPDEQVFYGALPETSKIDKEIYDFSVRAKAAVEHTVEEKSEQKSVFTQEVQAEEEQSQTMRM